MALAWRDTTHIRAPIDNFTGLSVEGGKHPTGTLTITAPLQAAWVQSFFGSPLSTDPIGKLIELYYRNTTTPLFVGWPLKVARLWGPEWPQGGVSITFEHLFAHLFRRIIQQSPGNDGFKPATLAQYADVLAQRMMNDVLGVLYADGGMFSSAVYSGLTVNRGDASQYTPLTLTVATLHSPALSSDSVSWEYQDGRNALDALLDLGDRYNLAYILEETGTPGTWEADSDYPYEGTDKTASVVLSDLRDTIKGFTHTLDYTPVANTWLIAGDGAAGAQVKDWYQDANAATMGIWEDRVTIPALSGTTAKEQIRDRQMALHSDATTTIDVVLSERAGARFNSDFTLRDTVRFESSVWGIGANVAVVGYRISVAADGSVDVGVTLNAPPWSLTRLVRESTPVPGGRHGGGLFNQRDG